MILSLIAPTLITCSHLSIFDLTKQPMDIKDGMTKLTFKYTLSAATATAYSVYALVLYEQDIEMKNIDKKVILRSM